MKYNRSQKINHLDNSDKLLWIIVVVGILLRLIRYFHNPSFWFDESVISIDIINRSFPDFINPSPDYDQGQPLGFLVLIKLAVQMFGNSEYAFRLFPLLFGIGSLFLFYRVAKYHIEPKAVLIALGLFAILDPMVQFASELKSYSGDVFFALLIFAYTMYFQTHKQNVLRSAFFAVLGAVIVIFSTPSVFVLAGVGAIMILSCAYKKDWTGFAAISIISSVWVVSFFAYYFIYLSVLGTNVTVGVEQILKWEGAYMPFPPMSFSDIRWFIDLFFDTFSYPVGLTLTGVAALLFLFGCVSMISRKKETFFLIVSPIVITLLAAAIHRYPFRGRLILFIVPFILLIIAEGVVHILNKVENKSAMTGTIVLVLLFFQPLSSATYHTIKPFSRGEIIPVLNDIKEKWQDGDVLYVHWYAQYAFEYYSKYHPEPYAFDVDEYVIGIASRGWYDRWKKEDLSKYYDMEKAITQTGTDVFSLFVKDLNKLKGHKRVWILFTEVVPRNGMREESFFLFQLDSIGQRLDSFGKSGVSAAYLYDLSMDAGDG